MPGWLKTVLVLLIIGALGYYAYGRFATPPAAPPGAEMGAPQVGAAAVVSKSTRLWSEFSGRLTAVEQADVRPRVSGTIETVHFKDGAMVAKGDLLFTIDQRPYIAEVSRAEGILASARARAQMARREIERAGRLLKEKALSQRDVDQRQSDVDAADADVKSAEAALQTAKLNLEYTEVRAPIAGRAGRAEITVGNLVEAGMGAAPLLTAIVSLTPIYADFDMDETTFLHYIGAVAGDVGGIPAELGLAGETGTPHPGRVQSFDNRVNPTSGTIRVRAVFDNEDGALVPGMFARVLVGSPRDRDVLLITDRAVGTDQNKKFVLVVGEGNKVEYREVRLGPQADGLRIVEEGLKAGERIIVSGLQRARPGTPVTPEVVAMDAKEAPAPAAAGHP